MDSITSEFMSRNKLAKSLSVGNTILNVSNIDKLILFYSEVVGLDVLSRDVNEVVLGHDNTQIITLSKEPQLTFAPSSSAGLYHNAIVYKERSQLAETLQRIFTDKPESFTGSADHFVSEAFYFRDPEGNELELYFDKDKSLWEWENGRVKMGVEYIDPVEYINSNISQNSGGEKHMGHVHLKVGDIEMAKNFYVNTLGFDITAEMPQALFVSVGEYHHHIGMNSWQSYGAGPRKESLGLQSIELHLPSKKNIDLLATRLEKNHLSFSQKNDNLTFTDPWKNMIHVKTIKK